MKRILVAVDLTENATVVVRSAVDLARRLGARVRLFHAVQLPLQQSGVFGAPPVLDLRNLLHDAEAFLRGLEEGIPEELRGGSCVGIGSVPERLSRLAREYAADVVVIGAHEHGRVARALGTKASRIVNRMDRPVFVVRPVPLAPVPSAEDETEPEAKPAEVARILERLVVLCIDGAAGYRCAAQTVKAPERLHRKLERAAAEREQAEAALRRALVQFGHDASWHGSLEGAAHRRLLEALAAFAADAPDAIRAILHECQRGERRSIAGFRRALRASLPENVRELVQAQLAHVVQASAELDQESVALDEQSARRPRERSATASGAR